MSAHDAPLGLGSGSIPIPSRNDVSHPAHLVATSTGNKNSGAGPRTNALSSSPLFQWYPYTDWYSTGPGIITGF